MSLLYKPLRTVERQAIGRTEKKKHRGRQFLSEIVSRRKHNCWTMQTVGRFDCKGLCQLQNSYCLISDEDLCCRNGVQSTLSNNCIFLLCACFGQEPSSPTFSLPLPSPYLLPPPPLPLSMLWHWVAITSFIAEPKGKASNRDALSFRVGMYVCMYVCMYVYPQIAQCNSMLVYVYMP